MYISLSTRALGPAQNVYGHLDDPEHQDIQRGVSYLRLRPGAYALAHKLYKIRSSVLLGLACCTSFVMWCKLP